MSTGVRVMVVVALLGAVATVLALKNRNQGMASDSAAAETHPSGQVSATPALDGLRAATSEEHLAIGDEQALSAETSVAVADQRRDGAALTAEHVGCIGYGDSQVVAGIKINVVHADTPLNGGFHAAFLCSFEYLTCSRVVTDDPAVEPW